MGDGGQLPVQRRHRGNEEVSRRATGDTSRPNLTGAGTSCSLKSAGRLPRQVSVALGITSMTRSEFICLLTKATAASLDFARRFVENELPESVRFHVLLNQSYDGHAKADERVYPEDDGRELPFLSSEGVADLLVRDDRCPEWIDVAVEAQGDHQTLVQLLCCGRFTDDERRMYYARQGTGPFGIKSPNLPSDYVEGTRFRLPRVQPPAAADRGGHVV
jgi:hypothetical protein